MPSKIEWTDDTRNWQSGCTEARRGDGTMDPACVHCYARMMSARQEAMGTNRLYVGAATRSGNVARWTGKLTWNRDLLIRHMSKLRPGKITFVGSMTDLFHADVDPAMWEAWAEAARRVSARRSKKQPSGMVTLTKRADRLLEFQRTYFPEGLPAWWWPGVTVADQVGADLRLPGLMELRCEGPRVVSYEPAMGAVDWSRWVTRWEEPRSWQTVYPNGKARAWRGIGWLIAGGESGPKARPSHPDWFRVARDAAVAAGVPFHFKQHGEWVAEPGGVEAGDHVFPDGLHMVRVGKKAAGRVLDGRTWDEVPA